MKNLYKKRLLKLADFLEKLPQKKFNLISFTSANSLLDCPSLKQECGSTGCAIGWCPTIFPKLTTYVSGGTWSGPVDIALRDNTKIINWEMAESLFGLTERQGQYLFSPDHYHPSKRGPKSVAARIRQFVRNDGRIKENTKAYSGSYYI